MTERNHHQHLRRPPDVEEALSSMLWTPYERTPSDSSSSDDDDVKLNNRLQKSQNSYESAAMAAVPTFVPMPTSYFDCDDFLLPATVATATAAATVASFVPFSNIMLSSNSQQHFLHHHSQQQQQQQFVASAPFASSNYHHKGYDPATKSNYRFSYPYYGPIPSLNKWWSTSNTSGAGTMVEPPSYDSLYAKSTATRIASSTLRPVLRSLKASVTTLSNDSAAVAKAEAERLSTVAIVESGGRMVHSFTDNFIAEVSC